MDTIGIATCVFLLIVLVVGLGSIYANYQANKPNISQKRKKALSSGELPKPEEQSNETTSVDNQPVSGSSFMNLQYDTFWPGGLMGDTYYPVGYYPQDSLIEEDSPEQAHDKDEKTSD